MNARLEVARAATEFAKADQAYVSRVHQVLHGAFGKATAAVPSPEELQELQHLRAVRDELEQRFFAVWVGDGWSATPG